MSISEEARDCRVFRSQGQPMTGNPGIFVAFRRGPILDLRVDYLVPLPLVTEWDFTEWVIHGRLNIRLRERWATDG